MILEAAHILDEDNQQLFADIIPSLSLLETDRQDPVEHIIGILYQQTRPTFVF